MVKATKRIDFDAVRRLNPRRVRNGWDTYQVVSTKLVIPETNADLYSCVLEDSDGRFWQLFFVWHAMENRYSFFGEEPPEEPEPFNLFNPSFDPALAEEVFSYEETVVRYQ